MIREGGAIPLALPGLDPTRFTLLGRGAPPFSLGEKMAGP